MKVRDRAGGILALADKVLVASGCDRETALTGFGQDMPDGFLQKPFRGAVLEKETSESLA